MCRPRLQEHNNSSWSRGIPGKAWLERLLWKYRLPLLVWGRNNSIISCCAPITQQFKARSNILRRGAMQTLKMLGSHPLNQVLLYLSRIQTCMGGETIASKSILSENSWSGYSSWKRTLAGSWAWRIKDGRTRLPATNSCFHEGLLFASGVRILNATVP